MYHTAIRQMTQNANAITANAKTANAVKIAPVIVKPAPIAKTTAKAENAK